VTEPGDAVAEGFDTHDPRLAVDPYPVYARLRAAGPVAWSQAWGGYWVAICHPEVTAAANRPETFWTSAVLADGTLQGVSIPALGQTRGMLPLELDPPECLEYRRLLAARYSAATVRARLPELRELAARCVDEVIDAGSCDIVEALTLRLPGIVMMRDIGLPESRWRDIGSMLRRALLRAPHDLDGAREGALLVCQEVVEAIEAHRGARATAGGGIIGELMRSHVGAARVADDEIVSMVYLLLLGVDPTSTLTATALWYLARHPGLRARLTADLSLVPRAAEEFLRWVSPVQATSRVAGSEVELGGRVVHSGDRVLLIWASANRDEAVYRDADSIDVDRGARHLAFGGGIHYCLGAHLARAMFTVMVEEVVTRMPDYRVVEDAVAWFPDLSAVYGVTALPITYPARHGR
jgi:cytochrome P450